MVYYPLALLMRCGIREVLIVTSPEWMESYRALLGDGAELGMSIAYQEQKDPIGIPDGLVVAGDWLANEGCCFILGDNLFLGNLDPVREAMTMAEGARIFAVPTREPQRFGIVELGANHEVISVQEKPLDPKSDLAIPGVYLFDGTVAKRAGLLSPSTRGETEICELMASYLKEKTLECRKLGRGFIWLDAGTPEGLLEAGNLVATMAHRTGFEVACLEEIAWREGWIDDEALRNLAKVQVSAARESYLIALLKQN